MHLSRTDWGRECLSDRGVRVVRVRGVRRADGTFGDGWEVQVRRPPRRKVLRHVARTLAQAREWARRHWRPDFLEGLVQDLPVNHPGHNLHQQAVLGDPDAFLALLDAAEDAGKTVERGRLTLLARGEQLFAVDLPVRPEEQACRATILARHAAWSCHCKGFRYRRGIIRYGEDLVVYYNDNLFAADQGMRPRILAAAKERLRADGIEALAEAYYPTGNTVAIAFRAGRKQGKHISEVIADCIKAETSDLTAVA